MITLEAIQRDFPTLAGKSYLNTAAEGVPPLAVGQALQEYWNDKKQGMDGRTAHFAREAEARRYAAQLIQLQPEEIGFCSCSAEAYNLLATALSLNEQDEVIISDLDFPSGATPWLANRIKPVVKVWKSRQGALDLNDLALLLSDRTRLVQVSLVSFYNGWRLPWAPFVDLVREKAQGTVVSVDLTQAFGRCVLDCHGADILISSTHKWLLGLHGGCIVAIPGRSASRLTTTAGGWYHLSNAFAPDRFERAVPKAGAASYSVGMPSFAPIYALQASLSYLLGIGIDNIARHADPLVAQLHTGLAQRGISPLAPYDAAHPSGIVAFLHPQSDRLHDFLRKQNIHIMNQAGRLRLSVHGYNTPFDIETFFRQLDAVR